MAKDSVVVEQETRVVEKLFSKCNFVGVVAMVENGEVQQVVLTWLVEKPNSQMWNEFLLPGGKFWLEDLHGAIGKMLTAIRRSEDRKCLLYRTGILGKDEA